MLSLPGYGPRKIMAALLVIGAIPSGLAGTVHSAGGLYTIRFFIGSSLHHSSRSTSFPIYFHSRLLKLTWRCSSGILGATFVPCQAWTTVFYDKNIVGRANALVGGWGNAGGGFTFIIMVALYNKLRDDGLSAHSAWRGTSNTLQWRALCVDSSFHAAAFAIVPVPVLLFVAAAVMIFGTDHPNGAWKDRHNIPAAHLELDSSGRPINTAHPSSDVEKTMDRGTETAVVPVDEHGGEGENDAGEGGLKKTESQTTETTMASGRQGHEKKRFEVKAQDVIEEESGTCIWFT